jgi:hypothetical protein
MGLKVDTIQEPTSATVNLTLGTTGNVTVGANLAVAGTSTFTGGVTQTGSSTAASFIPTGATVPANGMYLSAANTLNLATNSTNRMTIASDGSVTAGATTNFMLVSGTALTSPFATATGPEFTGIPSWVKRITLMCSSLSPSSTANMLIQLGSTTYTTTGYRGVGQNWGPTSTTTTSYTTGFGIGNTTGTAADSFNGLFTISLLGSNLWTCSGSVGRDNSNLGSATAGAVTLSGTLDRIRFYIDGTATFDAGTINIQYE